MLAALLAFFLASAAFGAFGVTAAPRFDAVVAAAAFAVAVICRRLQFGLWHTLAGVALVAMCLLTVLAFYVLPVPDVPFDERILSAAYGLLLAVGGAALGFAVTSLIPRGGFKRKSQ